MVRNFGEEAWDNALRSSGRRRRRDGHLPFTRAAKKALELSLREALAHKDATINCEYLLLGIMRGGDQVAVSLIGEHADPAQLRADIVALLDEAA